MAKNTEANKTVTLDYPLKRGEKEINTISLRKPQAGELRGLNLNDVLNMDVTAMHKLLPRITTPTLTEQEVAQLDPADLVEMGTEMAGFFLRKEKKEEASQLA